jgi:acetyl esterase/lipase
MKAFICAAIMMGAGSSMAAEPAELPLWPGVPSGASTGTVEQMEGRRLNFPGFGSNRFVRRVTRPTLAWHVPDGPHASNRAAIVICPGGGYGGLAIDKEGAAPAIALARAGVVAVVLKYRMPVPSATGGGDPFPLVDVREAVRQVWARAKELGVTRVGVMGFSAGGHLAGLAAMERGQQDAASRVDFAVLVYPVVKMTGPLEHAGSRKNLLGDSVTDEEADRWSLDRRARPDSAPVYFVHSDDDPVPAAGSRLLEERLKELGVRTGSRYFPKGGHGFGLGPKGHPAEGWLTGAVEWVGP